MPNGGPIELSTPAGRSCSSASQCWKPVPVLASDPVDLDQVQRRLRDRLDALGPAPRAELLHVLMLPDFERADAIGSYWGDPKTRTFAELLIDCEEDQTLRSAARSNGSLVCHWAWPKTEVSRQRLHR